jgi:F0F1-type ATP synthase assembly protein I
MFTLITGVTAAVMVAVFLGYYALRIESIPLWLIIIGVLGMVIADFVQTWRKEQNDTSNDG